MTLDLSQTDTGLRGFIEYNTDIFDRWRIEKMAEHLTTVLEGFVSQPEARADELPLMRQRESQHLLMNWNRSERDYDLSCCVHDLIGSRARRHPRRVAVVCAGGQLTYRQLNRRSNQLAHYLRKNGVVSETLVGICLDRSLDMVVAVLAVMKAGGAYVPLDPEFPKQRLELMIEDSRLSVLVTDSSLLDDLPQLDGKVVCVDRDAQRIEAEPTGDPHPMARPDNAVYVIYTSGSTGRPKGVVITHRSLLNFLLSMSEETSFCSHDVMVAVTTLSFDISKLEILLPLLKGARTVIATREETRDALLLQRVLRDSNVTLMQATPATWKMLVSSGWENPERIKTLCGGEALTQDLARSLLGITDSLWNVYGPTETTIWSTIHRVDAADRLVVPLGHPLANTQLYILDQRLKPVPIGVPGELLIGGTGLAREYLHRPDLTAERFIRDPFSSEGDARMYRTGDLVRRLPDGRVEFLGRRDHQVKIRGFRIELGEIEAALNEQDEIRQTVVIVREDRPGEKVLAGYLVLEPQQTVEVSVLRDRLKARLPDYMIPGVFIVLEDLPRTPNNKIDRKALPTPDRDRAGPTEHYTAPCNAMEKELSAIWADVLNVDRVGVNDNFFELGGHSLLLVRIQAKVQQLCGNKLSVVDLFQYPTVAGLARFLERGASTSNTVEQARQRAETRSTGTTRAEARREARRRHRQQRVDKSGL